MQEFLRLRDTETVKIPEAYSCCFRSFILKHKDEYLSRLLEKRGHELEGRQSFNVLVSLSEEYDKVDFIAVTTNKEGGDYNYLVDSDTWIEK